MNVDVKQTDKRRRVRNDVILIVALFAVAALGAVYLFFFRPHGTAVTVTVDGKLYGTYSLSQTLTEEITSGENRNLLVIRDGKAFVETATCPDGICVAHRLIFRNGESIVCLPNRVVVTVVSETDTEAPDIVV